MNIIGNLNITKKINPVSEQIVLSAGTNTLDIRVSSHIQFLNANVDDAIVELPLSTEDTLLFCSRNTASTGKVFVSTVNTDRNRNIEMKEGFGLLFGYSIIDDKWSLIGTDIEYSDLIAENIGYDNTESGLDADNVQDAVDEVYDKTLHLDQTTPQIIENGIPILNQTNGSFNNPFQLVNKDYIDKRVRSGGGFIAPVFFRTDDSDIVGYKRISYSNELIETEIPRTINAGMGIVECATYLYDEPLGTTILDPGVYTANYRAKVSSAQGETQLIFTAFVRSEAGIETDLFSSYSSEIDNLTYETLRNESNEPVFTVNATDRFGVRICAVTTRVSDVIITTVVGGENGSYFSTPIALRHELLRGREEEDSHPISAITDLQSELNKIPELTKEPTGFTEPLDVVVTYNSTARTVTLSGTINGYYKGNQVTELVDGWVSDPHPDVTGVYFLAYNGTSFIWVDLSTDPLEFYYLLIAFAHYNTAKFALRECHGLMPWQTHQELHNTIGTYKDSGGTLDDYVLESTTLADRRPSISACLLYDEDLPTLNPALPVGSYTQYYISGATGESNFVTSASDIIPLSTNRPYFNEFTGGVWSQTLIDNGYYMAIWVVAIPTTADTESQHHRYIFAQGQQQSKNLEDIQGLTPNDYDLGELSLAIPESVFISKIIIEYRGGNWDIVEVNSLTGTRYSQATSPTGNFLSSVNTDLTLTGLGTADSPLGIALDNENTWTGIQTFNSFPITPSLAPTSDYEVANKKYVDDTIATIDTSNLAKLDEANTFTENQTAPNFIGDLTGNADTATILETPRTIARTSFDGSANIDIDHDNLTEIDIANNGVTYGHVNDQPQTFYGLKNFNSFPRTPSSAPTADYEVANKKYVDDNTGGAGGDVSTDATLTGVGTGVDPLGIALDNENTWIAPINVDSFYKANAELNTNPVFKVYVNEGAYPTFVIKGDGSLNWGGGTADSYNTLQRVDNGETRLSGTLEVSRLNATNAILLNGDNINSGGTLSNIPYLGSANSFLSDNGFLRVLVVGGYSLEFGGWDSDNNTVLKLGAIASLSTNKTDKIELARNLVRTPSGGDVDRYLDIDDAQKLEINKTDGLSFSTAPEAPEGTYNDPITWTERFRVSNTGEIYTNGTLFEPTPSNVAYTDEANTFTENQTAPNFIGDLTGNADTVTNGVYTTGDQTIDGTKAFTSGIKRQVRVLTTSTILTSSYDIVICNNASAITITLPSASGNTGVNFTIKRKNTGAVTISGTVDGETNPTLPTRYTSYTVVSDGKSWNFI